MKTGFLEESPGNKSSMRLFSFLLLLFYFFFASLYIYNNNKIEANFIAFSFVVLIGVFIPKYLQSLAEIGARIKGIGDGRVKQ